MINQLLKQGRATDEIVTLLLDRSNGISAHIYDQSQPEQYARKQVEKAQRERATDDGAELERLALLYLREPVAYGRERKPAAKRLGILVGILDRAVAEKCAELGLGAADNAKQGHAISFPEPEPWPEPVNGAELLDDITAAIKRYIVMAEHEARACALWCVHTYLLDSFFISPRLAIRSATHRCGKTTLLDTISHLALRTLPSANVTAASVFRVVEACRPTLLIDEADTFLPEKDELRGVINSGHRRGGTVIRTVGDDHEPRQFSTYSACAIALIGKLPATLHDRSAPVIDLKRRLRSEKVENFRLDRTAHLDVLARKVARWVADHAEQVRDTDPKLPAGLFSRDADNWRPLLAIAEAAGGHWPEQAREAAAMCCAVSGVEDASRLELLLGDIRDVSAAKQADADTSAGEITSAALVERLREIEGHPWAEMGKSRKPLTQNGLARMLKPLGIATQKVGPEKKRLAGYTRDQFQEAFDRYLKPLSEDQPSQNALEGVSQPDIRTECDEMGISEHFQSGQPDRGCPDEKCEKPNNDGLLSGCPVAQGGADGVDANFPTNTGSGAEHGAPQGSRVCAQCGAGRLDDQPTIKVTGKNGERLWVHQECLRFWKQENSQEKSRIEALGDAPGAAFDVPARVRGTPEPALYEMLDWAVQGSRCGLCGGGIGVRRIKHDGKIHYWHPACADGYFKALAEPPGEGARPCGGPS